METRNIVEIITDKKLAPSERFEEVQEYIKTKENGLIAAVMKMPRE